MERPTKAQICEELERVSYRRRLRTTLRNTVFTLIVAVAFAVLAATLIFPVFHIYGSSMSPTLTDGNIVLSIKTSRIRRGDIIAFYYNNKILIKRVVALSGEWIDIDENGVVSVDGEVLEEPYLTERALGECQIDLPYQVPENRVFVLGDHRPVSVDSRNEAIGSVAEEQIVGKLVLRFWPLAEFGTI